MAYRELAEAAEALEVGQGAADVHPELEPI
jgi:hypothetical protein